ncbi:hypothetical protein PTNB29_01253 [Pyrenophora teres f. teres]|nr:hypothetical protein PTNB29_01253 [Pyrenophora teres f. teres]
MLAVAGMSNIKSRLHKVRSKLLRRGSSASTATRSLTSSAGSERHPQARVGSSLRKSVSLQKLAEAGAPEAAESTAPNGHIPTSTADEPLVCPELTLEEPTPVPAVLEYSSSQQQTSSLSLLAPGSDTIDASATPSASTSTSPSPLPLPLPLPLPSPSISPAPALPPALLSPTVQPSAQMLHRKIWVKRPNASATLVQIREDDLVDDVRDMILRKYANSLGRSFDSPDVTLRIAPRDAQRGAERTLGPEEDICRTLDLYFPGGQTVAEALIIDVPQRRTPKPSPRVPLYYAHHEDGLHQQTEYFPPMPVIAPSPAAMGTSQQQHDTRMPLPHASHSIAVLNTGQLPALPSPGGTRRGPLHAHRPKYPRTLTASPTTLGGGIPSSATSARPPNRPRHDSTASDAKNSAASNNPIPTPPATADLITHQPTLHESTPPTPRISSPQPKKKRKKAPLEAPSLPAGLLDGSVPPINVLIVEDNIINLRVLGAFMQRLKVRWQRAMNGKEAVTKWKAGGFHLVLMDIQLPVMNGLEATKEIRRLERVNSIGVFSSGSSEAPNNRLGQDAKGKDELVADDRLGDKGMFKSPVIIVALTASSLQSDRHEALAAGCNDFLTKPVNFVWLERKVKEWGCMQALIDFDGWRKWKDFADKSENNDTTSKLSGSYASIAPNKKPVTPSPTLAAASPDTNGTNKDAEAERKNKRKSLVPPPVLQEEAETPPIESGSGDE